MHFKFLLGMAFAGLCAQGVAQPTFPSDVARFIERRDGCDHFRGEPPYDEERRRVIEKNLKKLCKGTDQELGRLRKKYAQQPHIMEKLDEYEEKIEY